MVQVQSVTSAFRKLSIFGATPATVQFFPIEYKLVKLYLPQQNIVSNMKNANKRNPFACVRDILPLVMIMNCKC